VNEDCAVAACILPGRRLKSQVTPLTVCKMEWDVLARAYGLSPSSTIAEWRAATKYHTLAHVISVEHRHSTADTVFVLHREEKTVGQHVLTNWTRCRYWTTDNELGRHMDVEARHSFDDPSTWVKLVADAEGHIWRPLNTRYYIRVWAHLPPDAHSIVIQTMPMVNRYYCTRA